MLIGIKIKNFRSIKDEVYISLQPSTRIGKFGLPSNVLDSDGDKLLSSLIIYGRNASGKSNILKSFFALNYLVRNSDRFKHGEKILAYEPYLFDKNNNDKPTEFEIEFIGENNIKYKYVLSYNSYRILYEALYIFPKGASAKLFTRNLSEFTYGDYFKGDRKYIVNDLLENQLFLSKSANSNIPYLKEAYLFFTKYMIVFTIHDTEYEQSLIRTFSELMLEDNDSKCNIRKLLNAADTNILDFEITKNTKNQFIFPESFSKKIKEEIMEQYKYEVLTSHLLFENGDKIGETTLPLEQESLGTKKLLAVGGLILSALKVGALIVIDELDKSLHPLITKMLINLFNDKKTNSKKAQLIFATHDSSLLDNEIFRRDQICFADKEYEGNTFTYKLSDIKGVRNNIPYDRWYLSGRFRAIPVVSRVDLDFTQTK